MSENLEELKVLKRFLLSQFAAECYLDMQRHSVSLLRFA